MCHLACWVINQDPKEGHGKVWKSWWVTGFGVRGNLPEDDLRPVIRSSIPSRAAKVMRKRPDVDISVWRAHLMAKGCPRIDPSWWLVADTISTFADTTQL